METKGASHQQDCREEFAILDMTSACSKLRTRKNSKLNRDSSEYNKMLTVQSKGQCSVNFIDCAYTIKTGAKSLAAFMQTLRR